MRILAALILCYSVMLSSCQPKQSNEISEMAQECFKNKQGITIKFIPQLESKELQHTNDEK